MLKVVVSDILINIASALAISAIITLMAKVRSQKTKAILYTLPFPITIALIGSNSIASSLSVVGLAVTACFLWGCYFVHNKIGLKILYTDVVLALLYVVVAYVLAHLIHVSFWLAFTAYSVVWVLLMVAFKKRTFSYTDGRPVRANLWIKALTVFVIAYLLLSIHQYLAAFVVTFPYNGVFAVYENRFGLLPQAALFTRNSIALASYFAANYLAGTHYSPVIRYVLSWLAFGAVLVVVNRFIKVSIKNSVPATAR